MRPLCVLALLVLCACGRTMLHPDAVDGGIDAGGRSDAGLDAGLPDAGPQKPLCPPPAANSGRVWGTTPLGPIDFHNVWVGTEAPGGHSCPHLTVFASPGPEVDRAAAFIVDLHYGKPPVLGSTRAIATLTLGGKTAMIDVTASVTRADGLTMQTAASDSWRTTLTFAAADGGWTLQGALTDLPDCAATTWFCL